MVKTIGTVTANGGINFKSITTLNVTGNSNFTDQTVTSASATNINIGDGNGLGTYILTPNADFNLATLNMKFGDPDSVLNITSNGNVTATMNGDLNLGATDSGIIQLSSTGGNTLILDGVGFNLGTVGVGGNLLNSMTFSGAGNITVVPTINTANALATGIAGDLILNNVNAPINFTTTTNLTVSDVTGAINFGNNAGILNVDNGSTITGTINFGAGTEVTGAVGASNAITLVNFNAGGNVVLDSTSNATNFSIGNNTNVIAGDLMTGAVNYGAGAGTLILQNGLNGAITTSVANTGILTINGGNVSGTIGATGALNLINIGANPVAFGANVNSTNVALTNNASSLTVGSNVVLTSAVTTANPNNGVLNLAPNSSVVGNIGTNAAAIAAVNVGAGPASLAEDVYAGAVALTNALSSLTLNNGTNVNGAITNTSGNNNSGILIFNGGSITGAAGAPGAALNTVTFNANGDLPVASYAQTFNVNNAAIVNAPNGVTGNVVVNSGTFTGNNINGNAAFGGVGTINITTITGQTDFKGSAGTVNVNDTGILQAVTSSTVAAGNLVFLGGGNVTGVINNIGAITVNAAGNKTVIFQKSVSATSLTLGNNAVANLQDSLTTSGNVDFINGGILEFSGTNLAGYLLNSPITNGNTGTLNVYTTGTTLTATDSSIGTVQTINIGQGNAAAAFTVDVSNKALTLESAINLNNTNSVFGLTTSKNQQVTFTNNVDGFVNGGNAGGTVNLSSTSSTIPNNNVLTLQGVSNGSKMIQSNG
ncbi:MAG: hypothetical protein LN546_01970 [Rickettsia endosymbiont of Ecitomorpha arachnoides]|nr:hypothetical protein [Rickettsia endosymbiont of Ecitomorpha arachnoides]